MSLHTAVASFRQVRHPGTADTILHDFETMLWVANVVNGLPALNSLRLKETLNQFAAPLKEQVRPLCGSYDLSVGKATRHGTA